MSNVDLKQKNIFVIGDSSIIFDALCENTTYSVKFFEDEQSIFSIQKLDLLVIDKNIQAKCIPLYRVNNIINLTRGTIAPNEITLNKPLKLSNLLEVVSHSIESNSLFCCVNNEWIYHQRIATLESSNKKILLTDKENALFVEVITSNNFTVTIEMLKNKIWSYHPDTQSTTVETHLYKLRQKLPKTFLEIDSMQCSLNISNLQ